MKRIVNILLSIGILLWVQACEDKIVQNTDTPPILLPEHGYIFFDSDVDTRGELVEDALPYDFGVIGYKYSGTNWTGYEAKATPNVFVEKVGQNEVPMDNETVVWDASSQSHTYEPLVEWTTDTYAFFAYYPADLPVSGKNHEGTPYVTYTVDRSNPENHKDVMTSSVIGTSSSVKSVAFSMEHRLSAVSLYARSYVKKDVFDGLKTSDSEVYVKITDLDITLGDISYDKAEIFLDEEKGIRSRSRTGSSTLNYNDITSDKVLEYFDSESDQIDLTAPGKTMILIPQDEMWTCTVKVSYDLVNASGASVWDLAYPGMSADDKNKMQNQSQIVEVDKLDDKVRHFIILSFTKTGLSVDATKTAQWIDQSVEHDFE